MVIVDDLPECEAKSGLVRCLHCGLIYDAKEARTSILRTPGGPIDFPLCPDPQCDGSLYLDGISLTAEEQVQHTPIDGE